MLYHLQHCLWINFRCFHILPFLKESTIGEQKKMKFRLRKTFIKGRNTMAEAAGHSVRLICRILMYAKSRMAWVKLDLKAVRISCNKNHICYCSYRKTLFLFGLRFRGQQNEIRNKNSYSKYPSTWLCNAVQLKITAPKNRIYIKFL